MMQSKDSLEYSHYDTDKDHHHHSPESFTSSPINNLLSSQKAYSSYSSNKKPYYKSPPIKISEDELSSSNRYKQYENAFQSSKEKDYLKSSNEDFYYKSKSNPYKPYEDANNEKSMRFNNEESFQKKYRDQLYSSAKKIRDTLEESVDEIEKRINQIEKDINKSLEVPKGQLSSSDRKQKIGTNKPYNNDKLSSPLTFKEKIDKRTRFHDEKNDIAGYSKQNKQDKKREIAEKETSWSNREENLLKEMESLKQENLEMRQNLRTLMRRLEEEDEKNKENKREENPPADQAAKNSNKTKTSKKATNTDFDIEKEVEILKTIDKIKRKIQRSIQEKLRKSKLRRPLEKTETNKRETVTNHVAKSRKDYINQKYQGNVSKNCNNCSKLLCRGIPTCICSCGHRKI